MPLSDTERQNILLLDSLSYEELLALKKKVSEELHIESRTESDLMHLQELIQRIDAQISFQSYVKELEEQPLFNAEEIEFIEHYFQKNPDINKIEKNVSITVDGVTRILKNSAIKTLDGNIYGLARGKEFALGAGGYGQVKLAQHIRDKNRIVTIKTQDISKEENAQIFQREAGIVQKTPLHVGDIGSMTRTSKKGIKKGYIAQEYIRGTDLIKYLYKYDKSKEKYNRADEGRLKILGALERFDIGIAALSGLDEIHTKNIIHGDLKPHNIKYNKKDKTVKIYDFGLSFHIPDVEEANLVVREGVTFVKSDQPRGTGLYMSDEVSGGFKKKGRQHLYSFKSDVYAMGVMLKEDLQLLKDLGHLHISETLTKRLASLLQRMQDDDAVKRPTAKEAAIELALIKDQILLEDKKYYDDREKAGSTVIFSTIAPAPKQETPKNKDENVIEFQLQYSASVIESKCSKDPAYKIGDIKQAVDDIKVTISRLNTAEDFIALKEKVDKALVDIETKGGTRATFGPLNDMLSEMQYDLRGLIPKSTKNLAH